MEPHSPTLSAEEADPMEMGTLLSVYSSDDTEVNTLKEKTVDSDVVEPKVDAAGVDVAQPNAVEVDSAGMNVTVSNATDKKNMKTTATVEPNLEKKNEIKVNDLKNDAGSNASDTSDTPSTCPYVVGNTLRLQIDEKHSTDAKIVEVFSPFTLSCVIVVHLDTPDLKGEYALKLYDRRFSKQLRSDEKAVPWTPKLESKYREFVNSGCTTGFFDFCAAGYRENDAWGLEYENRSKWSKTQHEANLQFLCRGIYHTEKQAYEIMRDLQGKHVPRVFAYPWLQLSNSANAHLDSPGILMEYVQGYPLTDIEDNAPKEDWQYICDEAIQIIQLICVRGVLNHDIKPRSFKVYQNPDMKMPKLCMMDFGQCTFRRKEESTRVFREMQALEDEEGAIGYIMEGKLKGGYKYVRSSLFQDLGEEFNRE